MSNDEACLAVWKRGWQDIANNMSNNNLYCLFAYKPQSSWSGSWGAHEDYGSCHFFERNLRTEQLQAKLMEIYRIEAMLNYGEDGFTDLTIFEHDPTLEYNAEPGQPFRRHYRELTTSEIFDITEPLRLKAIADVEAERVAAEAKEAVVTAQYQHQLKVAQYESLKRELGL